jgi:hypothetical protein
MKLIKDRMIEITNGTHLIQGLGTSHAPTVLIVIVPQITLNINLFMGSILSNISILY